MEHSAVMYSAKLKLIVVFQGGGAKLVTLLAAAEILEELSDEIEICEVAGTSAGAIAAFALGHPRSVKDTRQEMVKHAQGIIEHFKRKPNLPRLAWAIFRKKAIYDETKLVNFFDSVFPGNGQAKLKLSASRIPIHIRTTDIASHDKHSHRNAHAVDVGQALADSCAIPFAIRRHTSESQFVDGGLISNLVEPGSFERADGNILALSFEQAPIPKVNGLRAYLGRLLSTIIDYNVSQSIEKIKIVGGEVCMLPNHFDTFDFERAFLHGLGEEYLKTHRADIKHRIQNQLIRLGRNLTPNRAFPSKLLDAIFDDHPYGINKSFTICILHSLADSRRPDKIHREIEFDCKSTSLRVLKIGISRSEAYEIGRDYFCEVVDNEKEPVEAEFEIVQSARDGEPVWHFCVLLKKSVEKARTPLTVRLITSHLGEMNGLQSDHRTEWMRMESSQHDNIKQHDFLILAPKRAGKFVMLDLLDNMHRAVPRPSREVEMRANWKGGHMMTGAELAYYTNLFIALDDFQPFGWRVKGVEPKTFTGTLIDRPK
jgi:hypothetical protein